MFGTCPLLHPTMHVWVSQNDNISGNSMNNDL
jgi:hypothetical protein